MSTELSTIPSIHIHYFWSQIQRNRSQRPHTGRGSTCIDLQRCVEMCGGVWQCFLRLSVALVGLNRDFKRVSLEIHHLSMTWRRLGAQRCF